MVVVTLHGWLLDTGGLFECKYMWVLGRLVWDALFQPCFMVYAGRAWCGLEFTPRLDVTDSPCAM